MSQKKKALNPKLSDTEAAWQKLLSDPEGEARYKRVPPSEIAIFNYSLKPYIVRGYKNVIHRTNYVSCNSAQCICDYIDFDTVEEAMKFGEKYHLGFRKCKLCFGGESFIKSKFEKATGESAALRREKMWEEEYLTAGAGDSTVEKD